MAEGNPLIIQWIIGQIDVAQDYDEVLSDLSLGKGKAARRVFDRSFDLEHLTDDGRDALLALSLFAPNASRAALAEVAGFGDDTDRLNEALKRLSMLRLLTPLKGGHRLEVKGLTRDFAKARLQNGGRCDEFRRRFIDYFLWFCEKYAEPVPGNYDALESEKDNLVAAIETAFNLQDWQKVMRLVGIVAPQPQNMMNIRGYWSEGITCGEQALKAARQLQSEADIASYTHNLGITYQSRGELAEARKLYDESLEIEKKLGNQSGIALTLHNLAAIAQGQGELGEARRLYDESLEINRNLGNQSGIAMTLHQLAMLAQGRGEMDEARRLYDESIEIAKKFGNQESIGATLHNLAVIAQYQGKLDEARRLYSESMEIKKRLGNQSGIALTLARLGMLAEDEGNKKEAARLFREALTIFEKLGSPNAEPARRALERVTE